MDNQEFNIEETVGEDADKNKEASVSPVTELMKFAVVCVGYAELIGTSGIFTVTFPLLSSSIRIS